MNRVALRHRLHRSRRAEAELRLRAGVLDGTLALGGTLTVVGIDLRASASVEGNIRNASGVSIDASDDGIFFGNTGGATSIVNAGEIDAGDDGIDIDSSTVGGSIRNLGTIRAADDGIIVDDSSVDGIGNAGNIGATATRVGHNGIRVYGEDGSTLGGGIANTASGRIRAVDQAIEVTSSAVVSRGITISRARRDRRAAEARHARPREPRRRGRARQQPPGAVYASLSDDRTPGAVSLRTPYRDHSAVTG